MKLAREKTYKDKIEQLERGIAFHNLEYGCLKDRYDALVKENDELKAELKRWKPRKVEQYTLDGKYIQTFKSTTAAAKSVYGSSSVIRGHLRGDYKQAYGYKWRYVDE